MLEANPNYKIWFLSDTAIHFNKSHHKRFPYQNYVFFLFLLQDVDMQFTANFIVIKTMNEVRMFKYWPGDYLLCLKLFIDFFSYTKKMEYNASN
jgi:hypothetical protein